MYPYKRKTLYKSTHIEVIAVDWPPGVRSCAHDHGKSTGLIRITKGSIFQDIFSKKTKKFLKHTRHKTHGTILETPEIIHIMGNSSRTKWARTIHVYTPLLKMKSYSDKSLIR